MGRQRSHRPTDRELAILQVLWERGPSTVREVHESLSAVEATGYTTTLKLMQIMHEKGLVKRDESERSHVYTAARSADRIESDLLGGLLDAVFAGSAARLVMRAVGLRKVKPAELQRIRAFLDMYERDRPRKRGGS